MGALAINGKSQRRKHGPIMSSRSIFPSSAVLIERLHSLLKHYQSDLRDSELRDRILRLIELHEALNKLGAAVAAEAGLTSTSARDRIRDYLLRYKGVVVEAEELSAVSGISEYGRRVRELREQDGFQILTGPAKNPKTGEALRPDQYILVD
jgi:hypothetical protein